MILQNESELQPVDSLVSCWAEAHKGRVGQAVQRGNGKTRRIIGAVLINRVMRLFCSRSDLIFCFIFIQVR